LLRPNAHDNIAITPNKKEIVGGVAALKLSEKGVLLRMPSYVWRELVVLHTSFDLGKSLAKS
jgi:hypothetical protein